MPNLIEIIKKASMDAMNESQPMAIMFGTVKSINPLKIQVDQKLILDEAFLVLTDAVREHVVYMTVEHKTEKTKVTHGHNFTDVTPGGSVPSMTETEDIEHDHEYKGKKKFIVHNGLNTNELVVLVQIQGGQKYLVLDRVDARSDD